LAEAVKLMFATAAAVASATASAKEEATAEQHNVEDAAPEKQEVDEVTAAVKAHKDITPGSQEDQKELEEDKDAEALDHDQAAVTAAAAPADKLVVATAAPPVAGSAVTQDIGAAAPTTIAAIATAPQAARAIQEPAPATAAAALLAGENQWLPWSTAKARAAKDKESAECLSGQLQFSITMPGNTLQAADGSASAKTTKTRKTQGGGKQKDKTALRRDAQPHPFALTRGATSTPRRPPAAGVSHPPAAGVPYPPAADVQRPPSAGCLAASRSAHATGPDRIPRARSARRRCDRRLLPGVRLHLRERVQQRLCPARAPGPRAGDRRPHTGGAVDASPSLQRRVAGVGSDSLSDDVSAGGLVAHPCPSRVGSPL
jgi:hypothetical protein